jgi:hypothetical protein
MIQAIPSISPVDQWLVTYASHCCPKTFYGVTKIVQKTIVGSNNWVQLFCSLYIFWQQWDTYLQGSRANGTGAEWNGGKVERCEVERGPNGTLFKWNGGPMEQGQSGTRANWNGLRAVFWNGGPLERLARPDGFPFLLAVFGMLVALPVALPCGAYWVTYGQNAYRTKYLY